jgi:hypothetical protein
MRRRVASVAIALLTTAAASGWVLTQPVGAAPKKNGGGTPKKPKPSVSVESFEVTEFPFEGFELGEFGEFLSGEASP